MAPQPALDLAVRLIVHFEGFRSEPYTDVAGIWTIGYGSIRDAAGKAVTSSAAALTRDQAYSLLLRDEDASSDAVARLITRSLSLPAFAALTSFVYNLGSGAFCVSTLRRRVQTGDDATAAQEFLRWRLAGGRVSHGLELRRSIEASVYLGRLPTWLA